MWMNKKNIHAYCWKAVKVFSRFSAAPATQRKQWISTSIDCWCLPFPTQAITEVINASPGKRNYSTRWCIVWQKAWGHPHVWQIYHNVCFSLSLIHECTTSLAPFVSERSPRRNNSDSELSIVNSAFVCMCMHVCAHAHACLCMHDVGLAVCLSSVCMFKLLVITDFDEVTANMKFWHVFCESRLIQDWKWLYYLIREIKMWLNINHITGHSNTYFIF